LPAGVSASNALVLGAVCVMALAARVAVAVSVPNVTWPDEIFQSLEQAHRIVFGYGVIPWEFREGARSWLLPGSLAGVMMAVRWAGGLAHVRAAQVVLSALAITPVAVAFLWSRRHGLGAAIAAATACAVWFELVLFAPKALSEVVAAHVLVVGVYLASAPKRAGLAWAGAALALAVALRIHLAPAALVVAAIAARQEGAAWKALGLGAGPVAVAAGFLDLVTWGAPFHSYVTAVRVNLLEGKSQMYGTAPWYAYAGMLWSAWSWSLPAIAALALAGARRAPGAAMCALAVLVSHSLIAHKEYRFIYPAVALCIVLAAVGTGEAVAWIGARTRSRSLLAPVAATSLWVGASVVLAARSPEWTRGRAGLEATIQAGARDLCGLALLGEHWAATGGYTYLHRDVALYQLDDAGDLAAAWPGFDTALASPEYLAFLPGFRVERCWEGVCLARRPGGCAPTPAPTLNARLAAKGE
jgi:hypothetical protein